MRIFDPGQVICYECGDRLVLDLDARWRVEGWAHAGGIDFTKTPHLPVPAIARRF